MKTAHQIVVELAPNVPVPTGKRSRLIAKIKGKCSSMVKRIKALTNCSKKKDAKSKIMKVIPKVTENVVIPETPISVVSVPTADIGCYDNDAVKVMKREEPVITDNVDDLNECLDDMIMRLMMVTLLSDILCLKPVAKKACTDDAPLGLNLLFPTQPSYSPPRPTLFKKPSQSKKMIIQFKEEQQYPDQHLFLRSAGTKWGDLELVKDAPNKWSVELPKYTGSFEFAIYRSFKPKSKIVWVNNWEYEYKQI